MAFKKPNPCTVYKYDGVEDKWEWNQSTEQYENIGAVDKQVEIDEWDGNDLKSMLERNVIPNNDDIKPMYIDTTLYPNHASVKRALDFAQKFEIVVDNETKDNVPIVQETKEQESNDSNESKDNGEK